MSARSSSTKVSIWRADVSLIASGPLAVPLPKLVVASRGTPYTATLDSLNDILTGVSAKL